MREAGMMEPSMDQLSALKACCRVVEAGGFFAAADELKLSHTIMSRQVRQLDAQFLNCTTRRIALTGTGPTYYAYYAHARGDLVQVLPAYRMCARELYAVYPYNRHLSPKVRAFLDFAADVYSTPERL